MLHDPASLPTWTAVVLAGRRPSRDALADHFGVPAKALVPLGDEPLLSHVVRTLLQTAEMRRLVILSQDAELLAQTASLRWMLADPRVAFAASGSSISGSLLAFLQNEGAARQILVTTADNVLLTPQIVSYFLSRAAPGISVGLVPRARVDSDVGPTRRTWLRFRNGDFSGANLFAFRCQQLEDAARALQFWGGVEQDRKKVWRIARKFGPRLLLGMLLRRLGLERAFAEAGRRLKTPVTPVPLPFGRAAVDVDKLDDYRLAQGILAS